MPRFTNSAMDRDAIYLACSLCEAADPNLGPRSGTSGRGSRYVLSGN